MKKVTAIIALALVASGCSVDANRADLDEPVFVEDISAPIEARPPDDITVFVNVDNHPNIARLCIDGIAFRTISNFHAGGINGSVVRVEEWDSYCEGVSK